MSVSKSLQSRILADARAPDYWYVPHGKSVSSSNWDLMAEQLKLLAKFETTPWSEAQPLYVQELAKARLIKPYFDDHEGGFSAVARMQFPVWKLLGLAWVHDQVPELTQVGRAFISAKSEQGKQKILEDQLHRYQFYNPSLPKYFSSFRTFPILGLYRLLAQVDWRVSRDEFRLFASRSRSFSDVEQLADLILEWRALKQSERAEMITVAKRVSAVSHTKNDAGTTLVKVDNSINYAINLLSICSLLSRSVDGIHVDKKNQRKVQRMALAAASTAEFIEYETEEDWLAQYGQSPERSRSDAPWTTATEARSYYERTGRIELATEAFAREGHRNRAEIENYRSIQVLERVIEDILEHNLDVLETGLTLVENGRQFPTSVGPIDLLARDSKGLYVVIELKRGRTSDRVVGQTARYMTWVIQRLCRGREGNARAIIVGRDFDKHFSAAIERLARVKPYTFDLKIKCDPWVGARRH